MKLFFATVLTMAFAQMAQAKCPREAQVIGTILTQTELETGCSVTLQFKHFRSSMACPLFQQDANDLEIRIKACKSVGSQVSGIVTELENGEFALEQWDD